MTENSYTQQPKPNPDLKSLEKLIGTWKQSGELDGEITYEWAEGGFFLIQRVDFVHGENKINGMEIIWHEFTFGADPSKDIKSRFYSYLDGVTLDSVYEMECDTLTIWGGERGSPAYYKGQFSKDGNTLTGRWVYPGGGGYEATSTRVK